METAHHDDQRPALGDRKLREECNFGRGTVEVFRSERTNVTPITKKTEVPLFFAHSMGGDRYVPWYVNALGRTGRDTLGVAYSGERASQNSRLVQVEGLGVPVPHIDVEKAQDMLAVLDRAGIKQTDIVAESAGAIRTLIAVALQPDKFRNVVLVHPAGLDNKGFLSTHGHVLHHQLRRFIDPRLSTESLRREMRRYQMNENEKGSAVRAWGGTSAEQRAVAHAKIHPLLESLQKEHPHLNFSIIADKHDYNFRWRRLQKVNRKNLFAFVVSHWHGHGIGHKQERINQIEHLLSRMETSQMNKSDPPKEKLSLLAA